jgi:uncharacterized protein with von Willebrand factor type A (vWA) domain
MLERICKEDFLKIRKVTMNRKLTDEEKEKMEALGYIERCSVFDTFSTYG